jgi:outer membrane receptor protein involved in Fe transport
VFGNGRGSGFAAASYTSADGFRAHSDGDVLRGQLAFDYVAAPGTRIALQTHGSRLDSRLPGPQTQAQFDANAADAAPDNVTFGFARGDNRYRAGARLDQVIGHGIASGYFFYGGRTLRFPTLTRIVDANFHRIQGGARLRADRVARSPLDATIGFDYDNLFGRDQRWQNDSGARGPLRDAGYLSVPNLGAYSQLEWRAATSAGVTLGLRYDRVTYRFESDGADINPQQKTTFDQLSPKASAVWRPDSTTSMYASVARGLEVPVIAELSMSPSAPLARSVRPKSLWNYEVGARLVRGVVRLDGSVFYADVRGEFVPRTVEGVSSPENASRSRNIGAELGVTARATRHVDVVATYAFLDLRLRDYASAVRDSTGTSREVDFGGKRLPAVPRHRLTGEVRVRRLPNVDLGAQIEWQGVVYVESGNADAGIVYLPPQPDASVSQVPFRAVPARALVHLNAAWRLGPATVFGSVENLFGLRYAGNVLANDDAGRFYESGSPTSVSVGLQLTRWNSGL